MSIGPCGRPLSAVLRESSGPRTKDGDCHGACGPLTATGWLVSHPQADTGDTLDHATRQWVLDAAVEELTVTGVGAFTLDGVAARTGIDAGAIQQVWPNTPALFAAAMRMFGDRHIPIPDTGTLAGDLLQYARAYAETVNSSTGRRMLDAMIVRRKDWDLTESRTTFLTGRESRIGVIVRRGVDRGQCPPDTDPALTIDMLGIGLCLPVLYYDRPITDDHCQYVVATLLNGINGNR